MIAEEVFYLLCPHPPEKLVDIAWGILGPEKLADIAWGILKAELSLTIASDGGVFVFEEIEEGIYQTVKMEKFECKQKKEDGFLTLEIEYSATGFYAFRSVSKTFLMDPPNTINLQRAFSNVTFLEAL